MPKTTFLSVDKKLLIEINHCLPLALTLHTLPSDKRTPHEIRVDKCWSALIRVLYPKALK